MKSKQHKPSEEMDIKYIPGTEKELLKQHEEAINQAIAQERERIAEEYKNRRATIKWLWNKENTDEGKLGMVLKQLDFLSEVITNNHE